MAESMLANLLRTPKQIREEELLKMQQQAAAQAQLGGVMQGQSSALPGIFSSVMQQQRPALATDIAQTARGLTQGIGGMLGAVGAKDLGRAVSQATVSPEERQAAQAQQAIKGVDQNNPEALLALAQKLSAQGLAGPAQQIGQLARTVQAQQAEIGLTQAKTLTEQSAQRKNIADSAKSLAAAGYSEEQTVTEIMLRNPELSLLEAKKITEQAKAALAQEKANQVKAMTPEQVSLLKAQTKAQESGVKLDAKRMALLSAQISTEKVKKLAEDLGITETEAKIELLEAEVDRYITLTPLEVMIKAKEIAKLEAGTEKDRQQAQLAKARLGDIGLTDFLREAQAANLSKNEYEQLAKQRTEARARTGGVTGVGNRVIDAKLSQFTRQIAKAEGAAKAMNTAQRILQVVPNLTTGPLFTNTRAFLQTLGAELGIESSKQTQFANQLFGVLKEGLVLEKADALKGALSDKDLIFLKAAIGERSLDRDVLVDIFSQLYYERYADQKVAEYLDEQLGTLDDESIRKFNIPKEIDGEDGAHKLFLIEAQTVLPLPTFKN